MNETTPVVKPSELIQEYIQLRDYKEQAEEKFEEALRENCTSRMKEIETLLLSQLAELGVDSLKGQTGTAFRKISVSATIADAREFRRHVIGTEQWDLANWSVNKTLLNELIEKGEPIPPGVNRSATYTISVRRKS